MADQTGPNVTRPGAGRKKLLFRLPETSTTPHRGFSFSHISRSTYQTSVLADRPMADIPQQNHHLTSRTISRRPLMRSGPARSDRPTRIVTALCCPTKASDKYNYVTEYGSAIGIDWLQKRASSAFSMMLLDHIRAKAPLEGTGY